MAEAVVGDDVFQDDPTVFRLETEVASLFGKEAALFVPSGTQGNQIAAQLHTRPGEEVAVGDTSHTFDWELAGLAALAGLQVRPIRTTRGCLDPDEALAALREAGGFRPACRLLIVENTHNFHGGSIVPLDALEALYAGARERGAHVHMDGARVWNASVASGVSLEAYGATADSIMACLSKGLGAPIGSVLVGTSSFIARARDVRKRLGGGMRQVGVLAAPALLAVQGRARLAEDHAAARRLAEGFFTHEGVSLPYGLPDTNIVFVKTPASTAKHVETTLAARGVLAIATGPDILRFVTHCDVSVADVDRALDGFAAALAGV